MSRTRTFQSTDEAAYMLLSKQISRSAPDCARKLSRVTVPAYAERRSRILMKIETTELYDGVVRPFCSDPIEISGWELKTAPFFLSYPSIYASGGAVFIKRFDETADLVDEDFYGECLAAFPCQMVLPASELCNVRNELKQILHYPTRT